MLLLDEPLGALDLKLRKEMQFELKNIQRDIGITFVHVTHDQEEAMTMADYIVVMNGGHIEQLGTPAELYEHPGDGVRRQLPRRLEPARRHGRRPRRRAAGQRHAAARHARRPERAHRAGLRRDPPREAARRRRRSGNSLTGEIIERAYVGVSTQYVVKTPVGNVTVYVQGAGSHMPGEQLSCRSRRRQRSSFPDRRRIVHERVVHTRPGSAARTCRRRVPEPSRTARRLRRRRQEAAATSTGAIAKTMPKKMTFSNWPLYIDINEKTKSHPSLVAFEKHYGVNVKYLEDINDNDSFFGKIEGPLSQGQSIGRDLIVMTDSSGLRAG